VELQESVHLSKCGTQPVVAALVQSMKPKVLGLFLRATLDDKDADDAEIKKITGSGVGVANSCWRFRQRRRWSHGKGEEESDWQKKCEFTD
jgi:hypothetical protein